MVDNNVSTSIKEEVRHVPVSVRLLTFLMAACSRQCNSASGRNFHCKDQHSLLANTESVEVEFAAELVENPQTEMPGWD